MLHHQTTSTTAVVLALSAAATASAKVQGWYAPATVAAGDKVDVVLASGGYVQQVYDVSTAYGVAVDPYSGTLGPAVTDSYYLGPDQSNLGNTNITQQVTIPSDLEEGAVAIISLALTSVYGAVAAPVTEISTAQVTIGAETSEELVSSSGWQSVCPQ